MAFIKSKELPCGYTAEYHKVRLPYQLIGRVNILVEEWKDEATRNLAKAQEIANQKVTYTPVRVIPYQITLAKSDLESDDVYAVLYSKLMALPENEGSTTI